MNGYIITGSIGSGKSTVADILNTKGYKVIYMDNISKEVFEEKENEIKQIFGTSNRKEIRKIVFEDDKKLKILEKILHSTIINRILRVVKKLEESGELYFIEHPLYFEKKGKLYEMFKDNVICVYADDITRIERIVTRDKVTYLEAENIVKKQLDDYSKIKNSKFVIYNENKEDLFEQIDRILNIIEIEKKYGNSNE